MRSENAIEAGYGIRPCSETEVASHREKKKIVQGEGGGRVKVMQEEIRC